MNTVIEQITELAELFCIPGTVKDVSVINNGHINLSYDVTMENEGKEKRYVFQKLNIFVFKNPKQIMSNIEKITTHILEKLDAEGKSRDGVLHFAHCENGKNYIVDEKGFWRVSEYVPDSVTYIGTGTFYNCKSLETVSLPSYLTSISNQMFYNCTALKNIELPDGIIGIGKLCYGFHLL